MIEAVLHSAMLPKSGTQRVLLLKINGTTGTVVSPRGIWITWICRKLGGAMAKFPSMNHLSAAANRFESVANTISLESESATLSWSRKRSWLSPEVWVHGCAMTRSARLAGCPRNSLVRFLLIDLLHVSTLCIIALAASERLQSSSQYILLGGSVGLLVAALLRISPRDLAISCAVISGAWSCWWFSVGSRDPKFVSEVPLHPLLRRTHRHRICVVFSICLVYMYPLNISIGFPLFVVLNFMVAAQEV